MDVHPILKKLNYKDEKFIVALNVPKSFEKVLKALPVSCSLKTVVDSNDQISFFIAFVTQKKEIDEIANLIDSKLVGDSKIWMCYPKGTSKNYKSDFNRDNGWDKFKEKDLLGVRMVAIDEDWSALRFRKKEFIKKITRKF